MSSPMDTHLQKRTGTIYTHLQGQFHSTASNLPLPSTSLYGPNKQDSRHPIMYGPIANSPYPGQDSTTVLCPIYSSSSCRFLTVSPQRRGPLEQIPSIQTPAYRIPQERPKELLTERALLKHR